MLKEVNDRILALNAIDKRYKSRYETFASLIEESGEFATELKIHQKTFGNSHKISEEGPKAELVDFYICVLCYFDWQFDCSDYRKEFMNKINNFSYQFVKIEDIFYYFHIIICYLMSGSFNSVMNGVFNIFFNYFYGTPEEFIEIANRKLDKWELSQKKCIES